MQKKHYKVYTARMKYGTLNELIAEISAYTVEQVKIELKTNHNLNPYYTVIIDETDGASIIEHNKFMDFCKA